MISQLSDREKTAFLTKLGFLYLKKMGCYAISTEVHLPIHNRLVEENDAHYTIDILGISKKYIPYEKQVKIKDEHGCDTTVKYYNVLRGIEVKVSRSDFKNGFIHTGCHYNYLLVPKGLVLPSEVHASVGLIEVDLEKACVQKPYVATMQNQGFYLSGIELKRQPKRKQMEDYLVNMAFSAIGETLTLQAKRWLIESLGVPYQHEKIVVSEPLVHL
jgi:hypothetical protein